MMVDQIVWHGTELEKTSLLEALGNNCACKYGLMGVRTSTCPSHEMLVGDQKALDGLVFTRRRLAIHAPGASQRVIWMEP